MDIVGKFNLQAASVHIFSRTKALFAFQKWFKPVTALIGTIAMVSYCAQPVNSVSQVIFNGFAGGFVALSAGSGSSLTNAPGITGSSSSFAATDTADPFSDTINFGTLSSGSGTSVANLSFRQRANVPCHVSCSVSNYTTSNMTYANTTLTGVGSELTFITLNSGATTAGSNGNTSGMSYGARFNGSNTLATLNGGVVGTVVSASDAFVSFTVAPSNNGNQSSGQNWVQDTAVLSIPTGLVWGTTGAGAGNFSITMQFAIFQGP